MFRKKHDYTLILSEDLDLNSSSYYEYEPNNTNQNFHFPNDLLLFLSSSKFEPFIRIKPIRFAFFSHKLL